MSLLQPVPQACQNECTETGTASIPGPQGEPGADGANGAPGVASVTTVDDYSPDPQPTMPDGSVAGTVVVDVGSSEWMVVGSIVFVQNWGWMQVISIPSDTSVELLNMEDGSGIYDPNAPAGTSLAPASRIAASGMQGLEGPAAVGALLIANNLNDVADPVASRANLGLGTVSVLDAGVASGEVANNDGALTTGDAVFATATGVETQTAATARTSLGLGDMALQDAAAVNIQGGQMNGTLGVTTPDTIIGDSITSQGTLTTEANLVVQGKTFMPMSALQSLTVGNTISPNASKIRVEGSGGAVTLTSTPTITNPVVDGQQLILEGNSDVNTLTLQDQSALGGSNLNLAGGAAVTLGQGDILGLTWSQVMGVWNEMFRANN